MPKFAKFALLLILAVSISGCSEIQNFVSTARLNSNEKQDYENMLILDKKLLPLGSYENLGQTMGKSCKPSLTSISPVSEKEARKRLKIKAARMGGNAITNINCNHNKTGDQEGECYSSITCKADVVEISSQEVISELKQKLSQEDKSQQKPDKAFGVGWLTPYGVVVTNHHLIRGHKKISLGLHSGKKIAARLEGKDTVNDIAIIAPKDSLTGYQALPLADRTLQPGSEAYILGFSASSRLQKIPKSIKGKVNATSGLNGDPRIYRITSSLEEGYAGSPVLTPQGKVAGIIIPKNRAQNLSDKKLPQDQDLAIKIAYVKPMLHSYTKLSTGEKNKSRSLAPNKLQSNTVGGSGQNRTGIFSVIAK